MVQIKFPIQEEIKIREEEIKRKYANYYKNIREREDELKSVGLKASPLGMYFFGDTYRGDCFFCENDLELIVGPSGQKNNKGVMGWRSIYNCKNCDVRYFIPESKEVQERLTESFNNSERNICA